MDMRTQNTFLLVRIGRTLCRRRVAVLWCLFAVALDGMAYGLVHH
jgi:hypothetical protein